MRSGILAFIGSAAIIFGATLIHYGLGLIATGAYFLVFAYLSILAEEEEDEE